MSSARIILLSILFTSAFCAARAIQGDSVRVVERDRAIVVTASSWLGDLSGAGPARSVLPREVIDRLAPVTMASTLSLFPGVFVKDYGGIGGLQLVSLRGGASAQALVLLDGARMSSAQNGSIDLSALPLRCVDRIEVIRGGASALYGANAVSGVVDVQLRLKDTTSASLTLSHGAFNEWRTALGGTVNISDDVRIGFDADLVGTRGSFPFSTTQFGSTISVNRQNGDARHTRALTRLELSDRHFATLMFRQTDRGVPGAVVQGAITQARARLHDEDLMGLLRSTIYNSGIDRVVLLASVRIMDQHFSDPDATIVGTQGVDVSYRQRDATVSALWNRQSRNMLSTIRVDVSHADLHGASIVSRNGETVIRRGVSVSVDLTVPELIDNQTELRTAMRVDVFSDAGTAVSPLVSLRRAISSGLSVRASWSLSFRPPSFNELYYLNYGTRDLRPERSASFDIGLVAEPFSWFSIDLAGYTATIDDLIVSVPVSPVITSAQNVGRASSIGGEILARARSHDGRFLAQWSYALQFMRDATGRGGVDGTLVPYAVPELISTLVQWDSQEWFASLNWSYTGFRYALPGEQRSAMLTPFALTSVQLGMRMMGRMTRGMLMLQADNLFDIPYEVVRGYPMPGRAIRVIANVELQ